ncbi:MAG: KEOPS complex subunit Cgi121 [Candidatus Caldarchaeum sp.]
MRVVHARGFYCAAGVLELINTSPAELVEKVLRSFENTQLIDPDVILDWDVFDAAFLNAVIVHGTPYQRAKSVSNEVLLKLAATTQLDEAIRRVGLKDTSKRAVLFTISRSETQAVQTALKVAELAGRLLDLPSDEGKTELLMVFYGIEEKQLSAVQAENREKAVKMMIMQRMAETLL